MRLVAGLKNSFVAGIILIAPLVVTLYVLRLLVNWSVQFVDPVVQGTRLVQYTANIEFVAQFLAAVLILAGITAIGFAAQWSVGRRLFGSFGRIVNVIPLVNVIYSSVRQVASAMVERETRYESVVLVEYPREGLYSIGLVTGETPTEMRTTGEPVYNVFLPNSPNPTAGRLVLVPESGIHEVDVSVRQGLRMIVTTGINAEEETIPVREFDDAVSGSLGPDR